MFIRYIGKANDSCPQSCFAMGGGAYPTLIILLSLAFSWAQECPPYPVYLISFHFIRRSFQKYVSISYFDLTGANVALNNVRIGSVFWRSCRRQSHAFIIFYHDLLRFLIFEGTRSNSRSFQVPSDCSSVFRKYSFKSRLFGSVYAL